MLRPERDPDDREPESGDSGRAQLERILIQLNLVEVLYLRLIGVRAHHLAGTEREAELLGEARRLEAELRAAQVELEELWYRLRLEPILPARQQGF